MEDLVEIRKGIRSLIAARDAKRYAAKEAAGLIPQMKPMPKVTVPGGYVEKPTRLSSPAARGPRNTPEKRRQAALAARRSEFEQADSLGLGRDWRQVGNVGNVNTFGNSPFRKSSPLTLVEIGTTYGAISKGVFGNFFKPQKTVYGTTIKRSPAQRMGTAALAGTLALGGGAGAVKAAPAVAHGASSAGSSVTRAIGDKVDDVRYWGSSKDWRDSAPLMRSTAQRTGKPQTMSTLTRDDWVSAGRPGQKNGYVQYHRDDRTGVRTFMPDGSTTFSPRSPSQWPSNG